MVDVKVSHVLGIQRKHTKSSKVLNKMNIKILIKNLFVFLASQPTVVVFYSPLAGFSLLVFEVS